MVASLSTVVIRSRDSPFTTMEAYPPPIVALAALVGERLTAPRAWLLILLPVPILVARYSFGAKRARKMRPQQADDRLPPSPPALPVLGHLHLVGSLPHVSLRNLARKHGHDLMLLRLGAMPVVIVSSPAAAQAVLRTHDHVFASRPHSLVAEIVLYGPSDVGFAPHGEYWRQARKLVTTHLLTVKKVQSLRHAREEEVRDTFEKLGTLISLTL